MIPILITCKDRLRYLDTTLKSISATVPPETEVYVVDDGSTDKSVMEYLTTNHEVYINDNLFPNDEKNWKQRIGFIPNSKKTRGIAGKVNVFLKKPPAEGVKTFSAALKDIFKIHNPSHVIKIQDDVIFKKNWYSVMESIGKKDIGIISGFRHFFDKPIVTPLDDKTDLLTSGHVGGILLMISATLCRKNQIFLHNNIVQKRDLDDFWIDNCRKSNMVIGVSRPGVCQHIGFQSLIYRNTHKEFMFSKERIRGIDLDMLPPYELSDHVNKHTSKGLTIAL